MVVPLSLQLFSPRRAFTCVFKLLVSHWSILFSKMSFHMSPQITCPIRCIVTLITFMIFSPVCFLMCLLKSPALMDA